MTELVPKSPRQNRNLRLPAQERVHPNPGGHRKNHPQAAVAQTSHWIQYVSRPAKVLVIGHLAGWDLGGDMLRHRPGPNHQNLKGCAPVPVAGRQLQEHSPVAARGLARPCPEP